MGTRGILGVRAEGKDFLTYNHFDSYPEGLGCKAVRDLHAILGKIGRDGLKTLANNLKAVDETTPPTLEQVAALKPWTNTSVSDQSTQDWYCLLRDTQGDLGAILQCGYYEDSADFIHDSLFCEWAYVVNLDTDELEIYKGFQHTKGEGRYTEKSPKRAASNPRSGTSEYWGVSLVDTIPLKTIEKHGGDPEKILAKVIKIDKNEEEAA